VGKLQIVVGGQAGSEAKGHVAAQLASPERNQHGVSAVRVAGPNAGHSAVDPDGVKWPLRQIPVAAVVNPRAKLYIAAGSEVDISVLLPEVRALEAGGHEIRSRLLIDQAATVLEPRHHQTEASAALTARVGSTGKGIGAARADRIMREARTVRDTDLSDAFNIGDTAAMLTADLLDDRTVQVEGTQGYLLGLHGDYYPQVTSSDCRAIDFLAMAGITPWGTGVDELETWIVFRPYPIRVAGNSGPLPGETTWEALRLPEERTTVTKLVRRVGHWAGGLARQAVQANGGPGQFTRLALMMGDQLDPALAGTTSPADVADSEPVRAFLHQMAADCGQSVSMVGTSDRTVAWI
jgi:adenylosuccinate synthase